MTDAPPPPVVAIPRQDASLAQRIRDWLLGFRRSTDEGSQLSDDIEELIEERRVAHLPINAQERAMLLNILRLGECRVDDVMVPRADIVGVEVSTPVEDLVRIFREAEHSRLPVFRESLDDVIGMVHIKDVFKFWGGQPKFSLARIARRALFVPPSMPVLDLLLQMQETRLHMALVVDEYGGTDGLVTIEDLMEQIVGEIEDEHDVVRGPMLTDRPDGTLEADARTPIDELEQRIGLTLRPAEREETIDTLGGLISSLVGRVPNRGELIRHPSGIEFEVLDADRRRLKRVRVRNLQVAAAARL
ncbi:MAG TPA: hemolysin family protein [Candidatus Cybelea sp.]|nr:hemolysin family protein [Candidatus Cybelea sp.]